MPSLASISDPKVYHILTYSTLFGSNLWNTFFAGPIAYKCLPRPQFATLQTNIFPAFFSLHTALPLVLAFTYPGLRIINRAGAEIVQTNAGWRGLLAEQSFWSSLVPIAAMFGTSLLNLVILGPATTSVMKKRKHQETRDGKRYYDPGPKSEDMQRLNKSFAWLHGASSIANLIGLGAMVWYGVVLAENL